MKKREARSSMWVSMRTVVAALCCWALASAAQEFSPPPLVQADTVDPSQGREIPRPVITNQPIDPNHPVPQQQAPQPLPSNVGGTLQPQPPPPPNAAPFPAAERVGTVQRSRELAGSPRLVRIGMSTLLGAGVGTALAIVGGFVGGEYLRPGLTSIGNVWTGGAIGFAVGAPLGVLIAGALFEGDAPWYAPILGDLLGAGLGAAAIAFGGPDLLAAPFTLPLAGSIVGYEIASNDSATVAPTVALLPGRGAMVGVQGRW
jgi:hypothetical protein